jgi:hypothetical protein
VGEGLEHVRDGTGGAAAHPPSIRGSVPDGLEVVGDAADGLGEHVDIGQRHEPEVVGLEPVEAGAMGDEDLLGTQQVDDERWSSSIG